MKWNEEEDRRLHGVMWLGLFFHLFREPLGRSRESIAGKASASDKKLGRGSSPALAQDGVTCSVCHQIEKEGLGTDATFNGNVVVSTAVREDERPEYGPFDPDHGHQTLMHSSTAGYLPVHSEHMRDAALCGSCHTLYTDPIVAIGAKLPRFPEQMPYYQVVLDT
jgi:hypothetical protein